MSASSSDLLPSVVTVQWLAEALHLHTDPSNNTKDNTNNSSSSPVYVFDASWYLPIAKRDPYAEYLCGHIPTARFFDLDYHADRSYPVSHMLPTAEYFSSLMSSFAINKDSLIVCYDATNAYCGSTRLWWTFLVMGHSVDKIKVLDGGYKEWINRFPQDIETGPGIQQVSSSTTTLSTYDAKLNPALVFDKAKVLSALENPSVSNSIIFLDCRDAGRFNKEADEPRSVKRRGRIPGAHHLFHADLQTVLTTGRQGFLPKQQLIDKIHKAGVPLIMSEDNRDQNNNDKQPLVVCYCGSGLTAATDYFVLHELGYPHLALYDASMAEWLNADDVPTE